MEGFIQWQQQVPPFTRYWLALILLLGALTKMGAVPRMSLLLVPEKTWSQPWRIVTSFCYFGDLSLELALGVVFRIRFNAEAERAFITRRGCLPLSLHNLSKSEDAVLALWLDQYKLFDWAYLVLQVATTFVCLAYYEYYQHRMAVLALGPLLDDVLLFMWCRQNPDGMVNIIGLFNISTVHVPWFSILFDWVRSETFVADIAKIFSGQNLTALSIFHRPLAWSLLLVIVVLHVWWFIRENWLGRINYDENDSRRRNIHNLRRKYGVTPYWTLVDIARYLVSPPWYWFVAAHIKREARESDLAIERAQEIERLNLANHDETRLADEGNDDGDD